MGGDEPVGIATILHIPGPVSRWYGNVLLPEEVAPEQRAVAVDHACDIARADGVSRMTLGARPRRPAQLAFLQGRGGRLVDRLVMLERILEPEDAGSDVPRDTVCGRPVVRLIDRPDLAAEWHASDTSFTEDIPGDTGEENSTFDDWLAYIDNTPYADRSIMWALLDVDGAIEAIAHMERHSIDPETLEVAMLGVRRSSRGLGLGRATKRWLHAVAWDLGARRLETINHAGNLPMEELNASLGYRLYDELHSYEIDL